MTQPQNDPRYDDLQRQYAGIPLAVANLDYAGPQPQRPPRTWLGVQFVLGLLWPGAYCALLGVFASFWDVLFRFLWVHIAVIVAVAVLVRLTLRWKAFIPGVLAFIFIAPVLFFILCCIAIGSSLGH